MSGNAAQSSVGLTLDVNVTETVGHGGMERPVTRGPRSDMFRSIGRDGREHWTDSATVDGGGGGGDVAAELAVPLTAASPGSGRSDSGRL